MQCLCEVKNGISVDLDYLTHGIRDAYANGLATALPTGENELGWAMVEMLDG